MTDPWLEGCGALIVDLVDPSVLSSVPFGGLELNMGSDASVQVLVYLC